MATLATLCGFASAACSALIDTEAQQCGSDADCAARGEAFEHSVCRMGVCTAPGAALGCPAVEPNEDATVELSLRIAFAVTPPSPQAFNVVGCARSDTYCDEPIAGPVTADPGEVVSVPVPTGFDGFLQITNADSVSSALFLGTPVERDVRAADFVAQTPTTFERWASQNHIALDRNLGAVLMLAQDCDRTPLDRVEAESPAGSPLYFSNAAPDAARTQTDRDGAALFLNVPRGSARLSGVRDGRPLSQNTVVSRANWLS